MVQTQCEQTSKGSFGTLLATFFPLGRADGSFARLLADVLAKHNRLDFARLLAGRWRETQRSGRATGKAVGKGKAEHDDEAMDYLLKPSLPFVAGKTLGVAIAKATAVAKIRIKRFLAIPLAGKVVTPCPVMAMPLFLFLCEAVADAHARANPLRSPSHLRLQQLQ